VSKLNLVVAAATLLLVTGNAMADSALAMKSGCMGCHQVDRKLIGPAFKEIAAKYAGDAGAADRLAAKVKAGSQPGEPLNWGSMPMPPSPAPIEDIKQVITWLLAQ